MIVALSSLITLVGLWFILRKYFTAGVTIVSLLLLTLGTNFFAMTVYDASVSSSVLLALMTLIVWMTQRWHEKPGWLEVIIIGIAAGCMVFVKPSGFAAVIPFVFWGAYGKETFREKWKLVSKHRWQVILLFVLFFTGLGLRMAYPLAFEGTWLCEYVQTKRAFYFLAPSLWSVFFSIKNGWLIYTPIVFFSIPGFFILAEQNKKIFYATFLYSLCFILFLASSPDVTTPMSFSQSRLTEIFAVLFIPFAYFISWVLEGGWLRRIAWFLILGTVCGLNIFQSWQFSRSILTPSMTTPAYFRAAFFKTHTGMKERMMQEGLPADMPACLEYAEDFNVSTVAIRSFETETDTSLPQVQRGIAHNGLFSFRLDTVVRFSPLLVVPVSRLRADIPLGFRFSAYLFTENADSSFAANLVVTLLHNGQAYRYTAKPVEGRNLVKGKWNFVSADYLVPDHLYPGDELNAYVSYKGNSEMFVDDMSLELFEPK